MVKSLVQPIVLPSARTQLVVGVLHGIVFRGHEPQRTSPDVVDRICKAGVRGSIPLVSTTSHLRNSNPQARSYTFQPPLFSPNSAGGVTPTSPVAVFMQVKAVTELRTPAFPGRSGGFRSLWLRRNSIRRSRGL